MTPQMTLASRVCPVMLISLGGAMHDREVPKSRPGGCRCLSVFISVLLACIRVPSRRGCKWAAIPAQPSILRHVPKLFCSHSREVTFLGSAQLLLPSPFPHAPGKNMKTACHLPFAWPVSLCLPKISNMPQNIIGNTALHCRGPISVA